MRITRNRIVTAAATFAVIIASVGSLWCGLASAQSAPSGAYKSYYYPSIADTIRVNQDSTLDVTETQTFAFTGQFHAAERDVSLKGVSAITDFKVVDVTDGRALTQSAVRLDVTDPSSWGKFAVWHDAQNNSEDVEWYFNLADTTHTWAVSYKVHGAVEFDRSYDRLYWNVFSGYGVAIADASAEVVLPAAPPADRVQMTQYVGAGAETTTPTYASGTFSFAASLFVPDEAYTIDAAWPKGIVSQQAFWMDEMMVFLPTIVMIGIVLLCLFAIFLWWLAIRLRERPGNVIPQYEPPQGLRPALAEAVAMERITSKGFAATIVDLAVRGWLRIEEDPNDSHLSWMPIVAFLIFGSILALIMGVLVYVAIGTGDLSFAASPVIAAVMVVLLVLGFTRRRKANASDYRIISLKDYAQDATLKDYEKQYLDTLYAVGDGKSVSTKDLKALGMKAREFQAKILDLRKAIGKEANAETAAFSTFRVGKDYGLMIIKVIVLMMIFGASTISVTWLWTGIVSAAMIAWTVWVITHMARRTAQGKVLHDEWLGFRLYLEVAEKYQLQNLTPEIFEEYLPYAMIFGIEKKWAKVFERAGIAIGNPQWYGLAPGRAMVAGAVMGPGGFSASSFSSGFSASFSSAIASSFGGAGGGGFGGGGAGGGGGGGGGGAR